MPIYQFKNNETGEVTEITLRVSELDQYKKDNPHLSTIIGATATVSAVGGLKTDSGFKEVLSKISEAHPNSELSKKIGGRTTEQIKTEKVTNKLFRSGKGHLTHDGGF